MVDGVRFIWSERMIPICTNCGHRMYYAGEVIHQGAQYRQYMCVHCDHIEYWLMPETPDVVYGDEFVF